MTADHRAFLPALPDARFLRFYDPFGRLVGVRDVHWQLLAQAGIEPGATVLEIGTGTGNLLLLAKQALPQATVIGLDPDVDALAIAGRKAARAGLDVRLDRGYADRLPYADGSIDRVLSSLMIHHLPAAEKIGALREVARVLVPGGRLHLLDIDADPRSAGFLAKLLSMRPGHGRGHGHGEGHGQEHGQGHDHGRPQVVSPAAMLALLGEAGLVDAAVAGHGRTALGGHTYYRASRAGPA